MTEHNIPDYCFTKEGGAFLLTAIECMFIKQTYKEFNMKSYWIYFKGRKEIPLLVDQSEYEQIYEAVKERDRLTREWINKNIKERESY